MDTNTDVGQTPYTSQPSKNTYTDAYTNMNTNTDGSRRPKTLYVPMIGEYVYLSSFLHKNN